MMRLTLLLCMFLICSTHSLQMNLVTTHLLLAVPLSMTIQSVNGFTRGFFSMFRRRGEQPTTAKPELPEEFPFVPTGPVSFPYPHQFGLGGQDFFFPQYPGYPGFGNIFQGALPPSAAGQNPGMTQAQQYAFDPSRSGRMEDTPSMNHEDAESFFTLLAETDEHQCISRLVCEMGASPDTSGEFAQSVNEVFSTLQHFPPGSKVSHYYDILQLGRSHGLIACASRFPSCDEESYNLVKNVQLVEDPSDE